MKWFMMPPSLIKRFIVTVFRDMGPGPGASHLHRGKTFTTNAETEEEYLSAWSAPSNPTEVSSRVSIRVGTKNAPEALSLSELASMQRVSGGVSSPGSIDHPNCWPCIPFRRGECKWSDRCRRCHMPEHELREYQGSGRKRQRAARRKAIAARERSPDPFEEVEEPTTHGKSFGRICKKKPAQPKNIKSRTSE